MDWIEAYKEISTAILALESIKHVDLYNEQPYYEEEEYPYPAPAVFLDFASEGIESVGKLNQQITFRMGVILQAETLADSHNGSANQANAIAFATKLKQIHALLQGSEGSHYAECNRVAISRMEAPRAYTQLWRQDYTITVTDTAAMPVETLNENDANTVSVAKP